MCLSIFLQNVFVNSCRPLPQILTFLLPCSHSLHLKLNVALCNDVHLSFKVCFASLFFFDFSSIYTADKKVKKTLSKTANNSKY